MVCSCGTRDPYRVTEYLNIEVDKHPFRSGIKGMVVQASDRVCIALNSGLALPWKRFVLAHEIGRFQLSTKGVGYFFLSEYTPMLPLVEREANLFAIELLVRNEHPYWGETVERFAARMGIPVEMVGYRTAG
ncbi:MAG: ImmA/IrrE family metallo-endopeptidase [Firmicutes bacterium]|nr:ImmA/IrrE family metallo-endopeptidase [Bacillota bacterium]